MARYCIVVLAYGDSPYLEHCIRSLVAQNSPPDELLCCTSTPSEFIENICREYGIRLIVNLYGGSIGRDWNFGLEQAGNGWVTLAHQDDIYLPNYVERVRKEICSNPEATMIVPWFREYADGEVRAINLTHWVKCIMFFYAFGRKNQLRRAKDKLRLLSWGNPVPCGGVALNRLKNTTKFNEQLKFTLDWRMWLEMARAEGGFIYIRQALMYRRIHRSSATSENTENGRRAVEELQIFKSLRSKWFSIILAFFYRLSYRSNKTEV